MIRVPLSRQIVTSVPLLHVLRTRLRMRRVAGLVFVQENMQKRIVLRRRNDRSRERRIYSKLTRSIIARKENGEISSCGDRVTVLEENFRSSIRSPDSSTLTPCSRCRRRSRKSVTRANPSDRERASIDGYDQ